MVIGRVAPSRASASLSEAVCVASAAMTSVSAASCADSLAANSPLMALPPKKLASAWAASASPSPKMLASCRSRPATVARRRGVHPRRAGGPYGMRRSPGLGAHLPGGGGIVAVGWGPPPPGCDGLGRPPPPPSTWRATRPAIRRPNGSSLRIAGMAIRASDGSAFIARGISGRNRSASGFSHASGLDSQASGFSHASPSEVTLPLVVVIGTPPHRLAAGAYLHRAVPAVPRLLSCVAAAVFVAFSH